MDAGISSPELRFEESGLWIIFYFTKRQNKGKTTVEKTVEKTKKTSELVIQLLISNPELTLAEISGKTGKSLRTVERAVAKLKRVGKIRFVGPKKSGYWEILK